MKIEHVNFNEDFWRDKTESEFIAHESHHGLSKAKLKEVFELMHPKVQKPESKPEKKSNHSKDED